MTEDLKEELEKLCNENGLNIDFNFNYPIRITISKSMQVNFFKETPEEAYLRFKFIIDQIDFDFTGDFRLDDKLFSKLLNKVKKLHYIYLREWYAKKGDRLKNCIKPIFEISNGDYMAIVKRFYEG